MNRNLSSKINELLEIFPAVLILGVRQCGKTTLAKSLRPDWAYFDLEKAKDFDFVTRDFDFFFKENPEKLIIDEAQCSTTLFKEIRGVIDADRSNKNRFILTGSSSPQLIKNASESLAGRIGIVELGTFKLNETLGLPFPKFYQIFSKTTCKDTIAELHALNPMINHDQVMQGFLQGGYPEPVLSRKDNFFSIWMENYFNTYIQRDVRALFPRLDLIKYQRFISMLSALNGTIINKSQVGRSLDTSEVTIRDYLDVAHGSFIWRNIPSYQYSKSKSVVKMPKGVFRDTGLSHFLQGIKTREQLNVFPNVGPSFESFVTEEIIKGLQATLATGWDYFYYRTRNGAEIDLILRGDFGILPIEIKFGLDTKLKQLTSLIRFVQDNDLPLGLVINNSDKVLEIAPKIVQVPVSII